MMFRRPRSDWTASRGSSEASMCSTTVSSSPACQSTPGAPSSTLPPEGAHGWFSIFLRVLFRRPNIALLAGKSGQGTAIKPTGFSLDSPITSCDPQPSRDMLFPASTTHTRSPILADPTCEQPKRRGRRLSLHGSPVAQPRNSSGFGDSRVRTESTIEPPKSMGRRLSIEGDFFGLAASKTPPVRDRELIKAMSRSGSLKVRSGTRGSASSFSRTQSTE